MSGVLTNRKLLIGAALMADQFQQVAGERIGIMLPASVAADVVFLAAHLAGKTPVMLNWTTGPAGLAHAVAITECKYVVTSEKLVDRLDIQIRGAEFIFLEKLRGKIGTGASSRKCWRPMCRAAALPKPFKWPSPMMWPCSCSLQGRIAAKTVPLTHRNLLTNVRDSWRYSNRRSVIACLASCALS